MDSERWQQVQDVFHAASGLAPECRDQFLKEAAEHDEEVAVLARTLLDQDANLTSRWEDHLASLASGCSCESLPEDIGPYRFLKRLGEGGMGVVYQAVHVSTGQIVAIKVLRAGAFSSATRERFAIEQRALARLDHPLIARLYGSERFRDGTPCIVMEYVEGETLIAYCDARNSSISERMLIFRQVCEAVQYAHEHAIIHRDLKPSNILVKKDGSVRLLDFGIAKQLEARDEQFEITDLQPAPMTLAYAAPEQVSGRMPGTHTDVYTLGLTLYELLTGRRPQDLQGLSAAEAGNAIRFQDPEKPSRFIPEYSKHGGVFRFFRRTDWDDLDLICMTAIRKDPTRRYRSVEALMRDLDHWVNKQPLDVRKDGFHYRLIKFARRNARPLLATAALVFAASTASILFAVNITAARNAALREQKKTERIENFVLSLFDVGYGEAGPKRSTTALDILNYGVKEARNFQADRDFQTDLDLVLGKLYEALGQYNQADQLLRSVLKNQPPKKENDQRRIQALINLGLLKKDESKYLEAEELERKTLRDIDGESGLPGSLRPRARSALGSVLVAERKFQEAMPQLEAALSIQTKLGDEIGQAETLTDLAGAQQEAGDYNAAIVSTKRALAIDRRLYGDAHPRIGDDWQSLGEIHQMERKYDQAAQAYEQAIHIYRSWYGMDHPKTIQSVLCLGQAQLWEKQYDLARRTLQEGLALNERVLGDKNDLMMFGLNVLATLEQRTGHLDAAQSCFERLIVSASAAYGKGNYIVAVGLSNLATLNRERGRYGQAEKQYRAALSKLYALHMNDHPDAGRVELNLAKTLVLEKRFIEARQTLEAAIATFDKAPEKPQQDLADARAALASIERHRSN